MGEIGARNHLKHVVVDGIAGGLVGGFVDQVFGMMNVEAPTDAKSTAYLLAKLGGQLFTEVSVANGINNLLYPMGAADDATGGFLFLWTMFQASPNLRRDVQGLAQAYQQWLHGYLDAMVKDVHSE
jgi:hypothetical protein